MIFPPSILRLRIGKRGGRGPGLLLPLFLLWPFVLAIALVVPPILVLRAAVTGRWRDCGRLVRAELVLLVVLCRLRSLKVEVRDEEDDVLVAFY